MFSVLLISGAGILAFINPFSKQQKIKPKHGEVVESIYGLGTVTADKVLRVRAGMTLYVQKLYVKEGDFVKPGDPLVKLDENVVRSTIVGTVTGVFYKVGELVVPQVAVLTVTNLEQLYLEVSLEQQSVLGVKKNQHVHRRTLHQPFRMLQLHRGQRHPQQHPSPHPCQRMLLSAIHIPHAASQRNRPKGHRRQRNQRQKNQVVYPAPDLRHSCPRRGWRCYLLFRLHGLVRCRHL